MAKIINFPSKEQLQQRKFEEGQDYVREQLEEFARELNLKSRQIRWLYGDYGAELMVDLLCCKAKLENLLKNGDL